MKQLKVLFIQRTFQQFLTYVHKTSHYILGRHSEQLGIPFILSILILEQQNISDCYYLIQLSQYITDVIGQSKIIVADDRYNQLQNIFVRYKLSLCLLRLSLVLEVLAEVEVLGLHHHLLIVQVYLNVLHARTRQFYLVCDLLATVRRRVAAIDPQVHILRTYTLPVKRFKLRLLTGVMLYHRDVRHLLFTPYLVLGIDLLQFGLLFLLFLRLRLEFLTYFGLNLGVGFGDLLFLLVGADCRGVEDAALVRVVNKIIILLAGDEFLEGHHRVVVHHGIQIIQAELLIRDVFGQICVGLCYNYNKTMKGRNSSTRTAKRDASSPKDSLSHIRTTSIKSNRIPNLSRPTPTSKLYEKMLTQTTSSKIKQSHTTSPRKDANSKTKPKAGSAGKGVVQGRTAEKTIMVQSLNIARLDEMGADQFVRNCSQQLSTNNLDHSMWMTNPLSEMLNRTHKTLEKYERTCGNLRKQQKEAERELMQAKQYIGKLEKQLARRFKEL